MCLALCISEAAAASPPPVIDGWAGPYIGAYFTAAAGGRAFNLTWQQALDLRNMLESSMLIARSALAREESRGAHYREDFPNTDHANWLKNIYLARNGDSPKLWTEGVKLDRLKP